MKTSYYIVRTPTGVEENLLTRKECKLWAEAQRHALNLKTLTVEIVTVYEEKSSFTVKF